ncbi:hypothetical protein ABLE91_25965 [Aquabacter sp. CN5-332]|uniref:hypothetical protein n=1 Tax=Aquabacter sp. CN5-332 TaxID=3156608 RepID=UPI0032B3A1D4
MKGAINRRFVYETRVVVPNPRFHLDQLCRSLSELGAETGGKGADRILDFEIGRALIRIESCAILARVEAQDLVACHSIKVAIEGNIAAIRGLAQSSVLWVAACEVPFVGLTGCCGVTED